MAEFPIERSVQERCIPDTLCPVVDDLLEYTDGYTADRKYNKSKYRGTKIVEAILVAAEYHRRKVEYSPDDSAYKPCSDLAEALVKFRIEESSPPDLFADGCNDIYEGCNE